ncbi:CRP-like cAMP-binding protein [Rhodobium orientis]|uniref:Crp/Fnr family transcriptional regulator n=1 Tax=Rhodobium orientis TaxID=34017 RepID=A0A327JVA6_9HYPH|nr:Crp/Fnr family transcriptional regulator [Rhodobium orientis]MBB4302032.1 CRP-like cAMP-binding protein [Rhodobium orientis]MBK5950269.1 Crp/Fnr family transcriptional regulator [Rhodobium orientis]RAI27138.1 Crp/Fnr family transcriptional regulator [Rhodobium orientis]
MSRSNPPAPGLPDWLGQLDEGRRQNFAAGEMISQPEADDNRLFVLTSGRARIWLAGESRALTLALLGPGGIYVTHTRAWVEALEAAETRSWPLSELRALIAERPELAIAALGEIGQVLSGAITLIEDLAFRRVEARLARLLITEAGRQGTDVVHLPESTETLASLCGTSRQTLSTLLNRMVRTGLIARPDRRHLAIADPAGLRDIAELSDG